jgi:endoglucanase
MMKFAYLLAVFSILFSLRSKEQERDSSWIRINELGYTPSGIKQAIWCSKKSAHPGTVMLVDSVTRKPVLRINGGKDFAAYGPFLHTFRLNFSSFKKPGTYYLQATGTRSPFFKIGRDVYKGAADFCLRYMRQQRSGFNPFLKDSCHTHDGYALYGESAGIPDSTHIDVVGGWHDATDYLQYSSTSANATFHLLAAYRDFPRVFTDIKEANGLDGSNGVADVLDEANWGLQWLLKMHPKADWLFNQLADDRDHISMRIPKQDSQYSRGYERPVYFINGKPQQRGKFMNNTTGTSSTAAKFSSAFSLGATVYQQSNKTYSGLLRNKAASAYRFALKQPGATQTVSVRSPYIYAEDNYVDDLELAAAMRNQLNDAAAYAGQEPTTPWLGSDTAKHYQWYPFINLGHYELAKKLTGSKKGIITGYYKKGISLVWEKARHNAFYRAIPYIWCSNNLTTSFAIQCYWYAQLTGDRQFDELAQANFDWLFGCNPWGTSMVYGLPGWADTPVDPHSSFTHIANYPIDGGLVDGPVYTSIFKGLLGLELHDSDEYAPFQSELAVYHDDYGDYSTNEPTMDGTASLIYLLAAKENEAMKSR